MIKLIRCDDRMIHGQCIVRVIGDFKIERIIGVDNFTAENNILKKIYQMAIPPEIKGGVYTEEEAIEEVKQYLNTNENTLLLLKNPVSAIKLFQAIPQLPKHLNIGPMSSRKQTKRITLYAYLTDNEITAVDKLSALGIRVYFNQVIDQKTEEWSDLKNTVK